jgi:hypothetical protein
VNLRRYDWLRARVCCHRVGVMRGGWLVIVLAREAVIRLATGGAG